MSSESIYRRLFFYFKDVYFRWKGFAWLVAVYSKYEERCWWSRHKRWSCFVKMVNQQSLDNLLYAFSLWIAVFNDYFLAYFNNEPLTHQTGSDFLNECRGVNSMEDYFIIPSIRQNEERVSYGLLLCIPNRHITQIELVNLNDEPDLTEFLAHKIWTIYCKLGN